MIRYCRDWEGEIVPCAESNCVSMPHYYLATDYAVLQQQLVEAQATIKMNADVSEYWMERTEHAEAECVALRAQLKELGDAYDNLP